MKKLFTILLCLVTTLGFSQTFTANKAKFCEDVDSGDCHTGPVSLSVILTDSSVTIIDAEIKDTTVVPIKYTHTRDELGVIGMFYDAPNGTVQVYYQKGKVTAVALRVKKMLGILYLKELPSLLGKS